MTSPTDVATLPDLLEDERRDLTTAPDDAARATRLVAIGQRAIREGHIALGLDALRAAILLAPQNTAAWDELLRLSRREGHWSALAAFVGELRQAGPTNEAAWHLNVEQFRQERDLVAAEACLAQAVAALPNSTALPDLLSMIAMARGDFDTAFTAIGTAIERGLRQHDNVAQRAYLCGIALGDFATTRRYLEVLCSEGLREQRLPELAAHEAAFTRLRQELADWPAAKVAQLLDDGAALQPQQRPLLLAWAVLRLTCGPANEADVERAIWVIRNLNIGYPFVVWASVRAMALFPHTHFAVGHRINTLLFTQELPLVSALVLARLDQSVDHPDGLARLLRFLEAFGVISAHDLADALPRLDRDPAQPLPIAFHLHGVGAPLTLSPERTDRWHAGQPLPGYLKRHPSASGVPLRVAVCVSGQLRSYRQTWAKNLATFARIEPTVFVSTWENTGLSFGASARAVARYLPPALAGLLPVEVLNVDAFKQSMPHCFATLLKQSTVTHAEVADFFATPHVMVNDEAAFDAAYRGHPGLLYKGNLNSAKMFFGIHDANRMRRAYEKECGQPFDIVIRTRPDQVVETLGLADIEAAMQDNVALSLVTLFAGISDVFIMSSSRVADIYADIWPRLEQTTTSRWTEGSVGSFAEYLLAEYLMYHGVRFQLTRATLVPAQLGIQSTALELSAPLAADIATADDSLALRVMFVHVLDELYRDRAQAAAAALFAAGQKRWGGQLAEIFTQQLRAALFASLSAWSGEAA